MIPEAQRSLYLFQYSVESPRPITQDWYVYKGRKVMREAVGNGAFSTANVIDCASRQRVGLVTGGGYSRHIVYEENGKGSLFTQLYPRITGKSKEEFIDFLVEEGGEIPMAFPGMVIDAETGLYLNWGRQELGHVSLQEKRMRVYGPSKAGSHAEESSPVCTNGHQKGIFVEVEGSVARWKKPLKAHFDFASLEPSLIMDEVLKIISYPDFKEEELRSLINVTLIVE